ncbi:MAG: hypothetical protein H0U23_00465 [Blastocatellia bacterium]|nr:hypothetical protein [Blastocatellia bacterium]
MSCDDARTKQILTDARVLIFHRDNWTQGDLVAEYQGSLAYCAVGAILVASGVSAKGVSPVHPEDAVRAMKFMESAAGIDCLPEWNDNVSHADVLAAFETTIASIPDEI